MVFRRCDNQPVLVFPLINKTNRDRLNKIVTDGKYWNGQDLSTGLENYQDILGRVNRFEPQCGSNEFTSIQPFWSAGETFMVPKVILEGRFCGANLQQCWMPDRQEIRYNTFANTDATLEPGLIIGKIIAEGRPIQEIFTTSKTVLTENLAHFYQNNMLFWDNFPGGSFKKARKAGG